MGFYSDKFLQTDEDYVTKFLNSGYFNDIASSKTVERDRGILSDFYNRIPVKEISEKYGTCKVNVFRLVEWYSENMIQYYPRNMGHDCDLYKFGSTQLKNLLKRYGITSTGQVLEYLKLNKDLKDIKQLGTSFEKTILDYFEKDYPDLVATYKQNFCLSKMVNCKKCGERMRRGFYCQYCGTKN